MQLVTNIRKLITSTFTHSEVLNPGDCGWTFLSHHTLSSLQGAWFTRFLCLFHVHPSWLPQLWFKWTAAFESLKMHEHKQSPQAEFTPYFTHLLIKTCCKAGSVTWLKWHVTEIRVRQTWQQHAVSLHTLDNRGVVTIATSDVIYTSK